MSRYKANQALWRLVSITDTMESELLALARDAQNNVMEAFKELDGGEGELQVFARELWQRFSDQVECDVVGDDSCPHHEYCCEHGTCWYDDTAHEYKLD
jgi:hypothetical protein